MLQFHTVVCTASTKFTSRLCWRSSLLLTTAAASPESAKVKQVTKNTGKMSFEHHVNFDTFKLKLCNFLRVKSSIATNIKEAKCVQDLIQMTHTSLIPPEDCATIRDAINTWMAQNNKSRESVNSRKSSLNKEPKKTVGNSRATSFDMDLLYGVLSTSGMITEVLKLAEKNDRDVQVLKYLFENIIKYNNVLGPGQCSSLMYSMAKLSYSDERLLTKICSDLRHSQGMANSKLSSILQSMASVRYKNNDFLKDVCKNILDSESLYSNAHITSILMSLAILGYESEHVNKVIEKYLPRITVDSIQILSWLNYIWSLTIYNKANREHVATVLQNTFIERLGIIGQVYDSHLLKLLNINAYARYTLKDYSGPFLGDTINPVTNKRSKQKEAYISTLDATLRNVVPSSSHFRMNINTNMGFLLDAELYLDSNSRPVCVNDVKDCHKKIAIMVFDYYDLCLGSLEPHGLIKLYKRLLKSCKYDVLSIPYQHFGIEDKMEKRVMYLKHQLWDKFKSNETKVTEKQ